MRRRQLEAHETVDQTVSPGDYFGVTGGKIPTVWHFDGSTAARIGVVSHNESSKFSLQPGETLRDGLSALPGYVGVAFIIHRLTLPPGGFYRRMARPTHTHPDQTPGFLRHYRVVRDAAIESLSQIRSLVAMLNSIFSTIHPTGDNLYCYGTDIRNLLILACTECEAQWRGIMADNGYPVPRSTNDYVKLLPAAAR